MLNVPTDVNATTHSYSWQGKVNASDLVNGDMSLNVSCNVSSPYAYPIGSTTVSCTVVDAAGNMATNCSYVLEVAAQGSPNITACPSNIAISTDVNSNCTAAVTWDAVAAQHSNGTAMSVPTPATSPTSSLNNGSTFCIGSTTVVYNFSDTNGYSLCQFHVNVTDSEAPNVTCPSGLLSQSTDTNSSTFHLNFTGDVTAYDNVDGTLGVTCDLSSPYNFPVGNSTIVCNATDSASNTGVCSFFVHVVDTELPVVYCPASLSSQSTDSGAATFNYSWITSVYDNVNGSSLVASCTPSSPHIFPLGASHVTCSTSDSVGNNGSCSFSVNVIDKENPLLICPSSATNLTVGTRVWTQPSATDNVDSVMDVTCVPANGSFFMPGTHTVVCSVTDEAGNIGNCDFSLQVNGMCLNER